MAGGEKITFCANGFESNIKTSWQQLQTEIHFCDVTLACEDAEIETHKLIISSFSPVLKSLLKLNQNSHPLIYITNVKYKDLETLINFMYHGEVNISENDLNRFLEIAKDLKIRGLSQESIFNSHQNKTPISKIKKIKANKL